MGPRVFDDEPRLAFATDRLVDLGMIHCVLYAAKSTKDRRGSIPEQLHDCRDAAARVGHYTTQTSDDESLIGVQPQRFHR
jgi:hypothetical protein